MEELADKARMMAGSDRWDREAEELNRQIIELDPENFPALYRRGLYRIKMGEIAGAVVDLSKVVSLKPNVPLYERKLEEARRRLGNLQAAEERARVRKERRERMRRISNLESYSEAMEIGRALRAPESPDLELAAAAFSRAWELEPGDPVAPTQLAQTYRSRGQLQDALSTYQDVLKRHDSRFAKVGLAAVLCDLHRYAPAARAFARAAEISRSSGNPAGRQSISALKKLRDKYRRTQDTEMTSWISALLERLDPGRNHTF